MTYTGAATEAVAAQVRATLAARKIDDATLALWLGVRRETANNKKLGKSPFTFLELHAIGTHLAMDYRDLLPRPDSMPATSANTDVAKASA